MEILGMIPEQPPGWLSWMAALASAGGLPVALWQLWRTRKAADAARQAALDTRERLRRYDTAIACQDGIRLLREIKASLDGEQWRAMLDRHEQLSLILVDIKERDADLVPTPDKLRIRTILKDLEKVADRIRRRNSEALDTRSLADLASELQRQLGRLAEIAARLHRQQDNL